MQINYNLKASEEYTIQVYVRRTGEVVSIKVIPLVMTYGDIIKRICEKITELEPSHYYIAVNYESQMDDNMLFERGHKDLRFQMIMKTKYLLEYIAEQAMQKQRLKPEMRHILNRYTPDIARKLLTNSRPVDRTLWAPFKVFSTV